MVFSQIISRNRGAPRVSRRVCAANDATAANTANAAADVGASLLAKSVAIDARTDGNRATVTMIARKRAPTYVARLRCVQPSSAQRGFTLVEVIVAVIIAALAFTALSGVFSGGARASSTASELTRASALAQSLLSSAGVEKPLVDGSESGSTADGLSWTVSVSDESTENSDSTLTTGSPIRPPLLLKRVTARVIVPNPTQPERSRSFELSTLRAVPRPLLQ